ncbi:methylmalonyl Co-A mutase-associated GTPase MeaB [Alkalicoccus urumqiensis]|uniref:Methylmalonyl Co-A mutase-associated GTPase MeaB n=2 Tax=Alkalicoccus urumqiensis TaxID=1548213 RepID=A0A2P6MHW1_ALKUR|nr:methylmalonyl Co-A mutase-associated GTPase MeaB [Alkalicoccus urumqiensis]
MLGRAISLVENDEEGTRELMKAVHPHTGRAQIIGITGSPGAGKSSLVSRLIHEFRQDGKTTAVCAVDPTSPFSGGALLGDRIRMQDHDSDPGVFIRSSGTRGSLGGLSESCQDIVRLMDAAGFDRILIETVGVGQAELDIMKTADTVVLVLYPSGGDIIQAFKAGIMEIADLFVINKADLPGVGKLRSELEDLLHISSSPEWRRIVETSVPENRGMKELMEAVDAHQLMLRETGALDERRSRQHEGEVRRRLYEQFRREAEPFVTETAARESDPYTAAHAALTAWLESKGGRL